MANNKDSESEENNQEPLSADAENEVISGSQETEVTYDENEVWNNSKKSLYLILGSILFLIGGFYYFNNSKIEEQSERSYRFLSASLDEEGAEERFLSFAKDYDDTLAGVALYRAAIIQYSERRFAESAKNFGIAAAELGTDPLAGRALIGQAISLLKDDSLKGGDGKEILKKLASSNSFLPADRSEARYLLAIQALAENDMENLAVHKDRLATDLNSSYFLSRLDELIRTKKFLDVAKSLPDINLAKGQSFLESNGKKKGVITLNSGLQYEVLRAGEGSSPDENDTVEVHYHGTLIDGEVFDSSIERSEPASFRVGGVIKGWTEALQLMKVNAKWKLFIPSDLAYGINGYNSIGPNETLIFEVELLGITPKQVPAPPLDLNITDVNSSSAVAPLVIPEVDINTTLPVVEGNASGPVDGNESE